MDTPGQPNEPPRYEAPPPPQPPGGPGMNQQYGQPGYPTPPPYYQTQPPRKSNPWMWVGITCLGIVVLCIIAMAICFIAAARNPDIKKAFGSAMEESPRIATCQTQLTAVGQALQRYSTDHNGEYPKKLDELVPKYMPNKSQFICPSNKQGAEYTYTKPKASDPGSTIVIECTQHTMGPTSMRITLLKDGTVAPGQ